MKNKGNLRNGDMIKRNGIIRGDYSLIIKLKGLTPDTSFEIKTQEHNDTETLKVSTCLTKLLYETEEVGSPGTRMKAQA